MENNRGKMTTENWWSFMRGLYLSVGSLVIVLLPYIEKGLMELQQNEDVDLAAKAVLLSNFLNLIRLFLKS